MGIRRAIQNIFNQQNRRPDAQQLLYFLLQQKSIVRMLVTQGPSCANEEMALN